MAEEDFSSALLPGDSFPDTGRDLWRALLSRRHQQRPEVHSEGGSRRSSKRAFLVICDKLSSFADMQLVEVDDEEAAGVGGEQGDDGEEESEESLLRRLRQSQARMEQIKRMLVNQRGFIVRSLRQMAEAGSSSGEREEEEEEGKAPQEGEEHKHEAGDHHLHHHRTCPMCEAAFPADTSEEAFETHVVEHFCFADDDAETLKYVGEEDNEARGEEAAVK